MRPRLRVRIGSFSTRAVVVMPRMRRGGSSMRRGVRCSARCAKGARVPGARRRRDVRAGSTPLRDQPRGASSDSLNHRRSASAGSPMSGDDADDATRRASSDHANVVVMRADRRAERRRQMVVPTAQFRAAPRINGALCAFAPQRLVPGTSRFRYVTSAMVSAYQTARVQTCPSPCAITSAFAPSLRRRRRLCRRDAGIVTPLNGRSTIVAL